MKPSIRIALVLFALGPIRTAHALPQMIGHGYTSCVACHFSPTGGGLLTPYGRSLSREVLSQTGSETEAMALYGVVRPPDWLHIGGDVRALQSYSNSPSVEAAQFILMQADLEMGAVVDKFTVVGSVGYQNPMSANATKSPILSRKHYLQYALTETQSIRAGKFDLAYGVHWPDHFMFSRRDLGWDEGSEAYRAEWAYIGETWQTFAVATLGRPEAPDLLSDQAVSLNVIRNFWEKQQVGLGAYLGQNAVGPRALIGPTFAFSPIEQITLFGEIDFQKMMGERRGQSFGFVQTTRLQYEMFKGLHLSLMQEFSRMNLDQPQRTKVAYTLGAQWFFRPHVEVTGGLRKQKTNSTAPGFTDMGWIVLHFYL